MHYGRRDANHTAIVAALRRIGAEWFPMGKEAGFDGIVAYRGRLWLVELKDGRKPPSERQLTDAEAAVRDRLARVGCVLSVWESVERAIAAVTEDR